MSHARFVSTLLVILAAVAWPARAVGQNVPVKLASVMPAGSI